MQNTSVITSNYNEPEGLLNDTLSPQGPITQAAPCQDSVYYEQLIPPLINSVHHAVRAGKLGLQQAGNYLLARHEDRLAYIQIMEKGNGYMVYSAKGLELQETSCHSLEATRYHIIFHLKHKVIKLFQQINTNIFYNTA